ncbi:MAG: RyR domain-containing protein [Acidobacteriota bacterium]
MEYSSAPRDTSGDKLPREISALTELLASNTHQNWARQRMADGWRHGPKRDDEKKEHPSLVGWSETSRSACSRRRPAG